MRISREKLFYEAEITGFRPEVLEKVIYLLNLLETFRSHPFLKERIALKGGTALNLFLFDLPRLSVDIDLNYIGFTERKAMLAERPKIEEAIGAVCAREGLIIRRLQDSHAGSSWSLRYESAVGQGGNLGIDLNFMFRVPLWPIVIRDSCVIGSYRASGIPVIDIHELAAGKLAALLSRHAVRDLFDVHQLLTHGDLNPERLRFAFIVYGALNRKDWRTVSINEVGFERGELENSLIPLLRGKFGPDAEPPGAWGARLVEECRQALEVVLPLSKLESEFLDKLLDYGKIEPFLLTEDEALAKRIQHHPALEWKALNVRRHKSL